MNSYGNYAPTSYGGFDAGAGGFSAAAAGGFSAAASTTSPANKSSQNNEDKSGASAQRLTPVTIAQVNAAKQQHKDDAFSVDGQELNQVSVVGTIKSVAKLSTNITLVVQDATGTIDVRQWLDSGEGQTDFVPDMRIKIVGHVREFQEKRSILAFKIVPAPDPQEAVYHQLLSTYVHLFHRFGPLPEGAETPGGAGAAGVSHSYQAPVFGGAAGAGGSTASDLQKAVLNFVKSSTSSQGAMRSEIENSLRHMGSKEVISAAIDYLCQEGHLYSTISEHHFKSA